jgi:hypothetical protein
MTESCGSAGFRFGASACPTKADHGAPWQATFHDLEHYYDVINNGMNELGGHLYIQGAVCFLICISLSLQGNDFIFSFQEFSISRLWRRVDASDEEWEGFKIRPGATLVLQQDLTVQLSARRFTIIVSLARVAAMGLADVQGRQATRAPRDSARYGHTSRSGLHWYPGRRRSHPVLGHQPGTRPVSEPVW